MIKLYLVKTLDNFDFHQELLNIGWINSIMEGTMYSPNYDTEYYYNRTPYNGQFLSKLTIEQFIEKYPSLKDIVNDYKEEL